MSYFLALLGTLHLEPLTSANMSTSQSSSVKKRLNWIDQVKGLAILGIILFHFFQNYPNRFDLISLLDRNGAKIGFAAVDIFFVVAGFNTSYVLASMVQAGKINSLQEINWLSWLKKRLLRLYPTYWLAIIISLVLFSLFDKIKLTSGVDFMYIWLGLPSYERFKTLNPGFWFFAVILQAYLSIPLIFAFCKQNQEKILWLGIVVGATTKIACWIVPHNSDWFWFLLQNDFLGSYFFQLSLGLYWGFIYFQYQGFRKIDIWLSVTVFAVGLLIYIALSLTGKDILYMSLFDMLFTPFFFILGFWFCQLLIAKIPTINHHNPISILGIYSYQIYLIHQPLYFVLLAPLVKQINTNDYFTLILVLVITAIILSAYVIIFTQLDLLLGKLIKRMTTRLA